MAEKRITIYLADDHEMVRTGLAELLDREDDLEIVGQCGDGAVVFEEVMRLNPDVLVLDISMPGLSGLDVCRALTRQDSARSVLMLTMYDDEQLVVRAIRYGASGYLLKESAAGKLVDAVRLVAKGELFLGPGIPRSVLERVANDGDDPYDRLTTRERQVLKMVAEGMTNRQIAQDLHLAVKTVDTHRMRLMRKLDIHDQTTLVRFAIRKGVIFP